jgi:hypothetical protein
MSTPRGGIHVVFEVFAHRLALAGLLYRRPFIDPWLGKIGVLSKTLTYSVISVAGHPSGFLLFRALHPRPPPPAEKITRSVPHTIRVLADD